MVFGKKTTLNQWDEWLGKDGSLDYNYHQQTWIPTGPAAAPPLPQRTYNPTYVKLQKPFHHVNTGRNFPSTCAGKRRPCKISINLTGRMMGLRIFGGVL